MKTKNSNKPSEEMTNTTKSSLNNGNADKPQVWQGINGLQDNIYITIPPLRNQKLISRESSDQTTGKANFQIRRAEFYFFPVRSGLLVVDLKRDNEIAKENRKIREDSSGRPVLLAGVEATQTREKSWGRAKSLKYGLVVDGRWPFFG